MKLKLEIHESIAGVISRRLANITLMKSRKASDIAQMQSWIAKGDLIDSDAELDGDVEYRRDDNVLGLFTSTTAVKIFTVPEEGDETG